MTTVNINYKGRVVEDISHLSLRTTPPTMCVLKCDDDLCKMIIFKSGKCRLMGCKRPLTSFDNLPLKVVIKSIQSVTVRFDLGLGPLNLNELAKRIKCQYEPELFPAALRLIEFNPLCVNVFASGKVVILGLRNLKYKKVQEKILQALSIGMRSN